MIPASAFEPLLQELRNRPLEMNKYRDVCGEGRSQAFGIVNRRCLPPDYSRQCWKRPYLYKLLLDFAKEYVTVPFNAITVNQNFKCQPHRDKNNQGNSFLIAFGDYTGGELEIHEGERKGLHNINRTPIIDDFSKLLHSVKEFEGERYSLVFYTFAHKKWKADVPESEVKEVDGKWLFYRGGVVCAGLPHPRGKNWGKNPPIKELP